ncbi:MAG: hypothetical protein J6W63_12000 [Treponema sp.]|nr:hypothetical protein [Treponema sp.]
MTRKLGEKSGKFPLFWVAVGLWHEICFYNIFYAKQPEISFGRNGKEKMAENPFARRERSDFNTYYRAPWIFRQIFLVVKPKTDFRCLLDGGFVCSTILTFG